ncbi:uncharacterized protein Dvar_50100 [Desulfosarcina variabilis str. Montpellier]|uniref:hypothetical protein n=1 Tax=Desulfosarcina variabilis TaxID=2300 RepID=UPI003AFA653C
MKKTLNAKAFPLLTVCVMLLLPVFCACTSSTDLETQVSGKWQRTQGDGIVDINLSATPKTVVLDGQSYTAEIEGVDKGTYTVKVKVQPTSGDAEIWSLSQKWNDNGSSFKLAFRHNGTTETLVPAGKS